MRKIGVCIKIRNLCTNNSVEALLPFNEGHQVLLKLLCIFSTWGGMFQHGEKKRSVLCCIASGKHSISRFSLREFDIWYWMLHCDTIKSTLAA